MVTDCLGLRAWDMSDAEAVFVGGVEALAWIIIPAAICLAIWRIALTNRRRQVLTLGLLGDTPEIVSAARKKFWRPSLLRVATAFLTFGVGLLMFRAYELIDQFKEIFAR